MYIPKRREYKNMKNTKSKYIVYLNNGTTKTFASELEMYKWLYEESWEEEGRVVDYGEAR